MKSWRGFLFQLISYANILFYLQLTYWYTVLYIFFLDKETIIEKAIFSGKNS